MEDQDAEQNVSVAQHEADPAWFAAEDHGDSQVRNAGDERCNTADETSGSHAVEGRILPVLVGIEF